MTYPYRDQTSGGRTNAPNVYHSYPTYYSPSGSGQRRPSPPPGSHRSHKQWGLLLCLVLVIAGIGYVLLPSNGPSKHAATAVSKSSTTTAIKTTTASAKHAPADSPALSQMSSSITSILSQNSTVETSVNLIDLNNGQAEHYGVTSNTFQAGSTAKIIAAVDWLHQVEIGKQTMSETVGPDTAANDVDQMITVSNDPDWKAIEAKLGYNNLQSYATSLGLSNYESFNNSLPSSDIALILQKLWNGSVLNKADTQLLLGYMKAANYREYIVPAIPSEDTIYHKIGFYETYLNDAAIVTHGNQAFAIVIFTNGTSDAYPWPARATMMQAITKAALQYYFNQSDASATAQAGSSTTD